MRSQKWSQKRAPSRGRFVPAAWSVFKFPWSTQRKRAKAKRTKRSGVASDDRHLGNGISTNGVGANHEASTKRPPARTEHTGSPNERLVKLL
eukprot:409133-Prorocentrum_minimum.AAC.2